jgi:tartrate dehydratase beta subunit/fumarate hydratase class I family protein
MPEAARCNAIKVSQLVLCTGSKIQARDQVEQPLMDAIRDRDRQRFFVKGFDIAAD